MKSLSLAAVVVVFASGCMGALGVDGVGGGAGSTGDGGLGGGSGSGGGGGATGPSGLPCDVAALVAKHCVTCHGATPAGGAPSTLISRADFLKTAVSNPGASEGQQSLTRMLAGQMPPSGGLTATELSTFDAWINAGMPEGMCGEVDAGSMEPTCASGTYRLQPTPANDHASRTMAPGLACISCHSQQNFAGQNPGGLEAFGDIYDYMGTVFRAPHEKDLCDPNLGTSATVEIYNEAGTKVATMPVNSGGNFMGFAAGGKPPKYTAKLVTPAGTRVMAGLQTSGDCNTCHTVAGAEGAPGRIYLP
jgi:mono/diheme cytochrome c family protein